MHRQLLAAALLVGGSAEAGTVDDARYLHWTNRDEAAAALIEPWLAEHPDDFAAHAVYIEIRVNGMGEGDVLQSEYAAWTAPDAELGTAVKEAVDRALDGEPAQLPEHPLPSILNRKWVKYQIKKWKEDPANLRAIVDDVWGLDAPIGAWADRLRKDGLALVSEKAKFSNDPVWLETARAVTEAAEIPGMSTVALERLVEQDPDAWPGALDDDAVRKVRKAARAMSPAVALDRLENLTVSESAREARQLSNALRAEMLFWLGRDHEARLALKAAWNKTPDDPAAALRFVRAAVDGNAELDTAREALAKGVASAEAWTWTGETDVLLWPEAYDRFYSQRRVTLGWLDAQRKRLDEATGTKTEPVPQPPPFADAAHHLAAGKAREDRIGTRHLVQAVRLARAGKDAEVEAEAKKLLEERKAWFPGGLDARIAGWTTALGDPLDLRPLENGEREGASRVGGALTDFEMRLGDGKTRLSDIAGERVLGAFAGNCDSCAGFLRDFDALAREFATKATFIAVDVRGDGRAVDKMLQGADPPFEVGKTEGDLPEDFSAGGIPRLYVLSADGQVIADTGVEPSADTMRDAVQSKGGAVEIPEPEVQTPDVQARVQPRYPPVAHWLGAPQERCVGRILVGTDGVAQRVRIEECEDPFATATREALYQWRWEEGSQEAVAVVAVNFDEPPKYGSLPSVQCLWDARFDPDGSIHDLWTNCDKEPVRAGPIPWSEATLADSTTVGLKIDNVQIPVACEVVIDVGPKTMNVSSDPYTCPKAVIHDARDHVRRWDWDVGIGRRPPVRLVLHFDPTVGQAAE